MRSPMHVNRKAQIVFHALHLCECPRAAAPPSIARLYNPAFLPASLQLNTTANQQRHCTKTLHNNTAQQHCTTTTHSASLREPITTSFHIKRDKLLTFRTLFARDKLTTRLPL